MEQRTDATGFDLEDRLRALGYRTFNAFGMGIDRADVRTVIKGVGRILIRARLAAARL